MQTQKTLHLIPSFDPLFMCVLNLRFLFFSFYRSIVFVTVVCDVFPRSSFFSAICFRVPSFCTLFCCLCLGRVILPRSVWRRVRLELIRIFTLFSAYQEGDMLWLVIDWFSGNPFDVIVVSSLVEWIVKIYQMQRYIVDFVVENKRGSK